MKGADVERVPAFRVLATLINSTLTWGDQGHTRLEKAGQPIYLYEN